MEKINLADTLTQISEHWRPKVVSELNGQEVKLVNRHAQHGQHRRRRVDGAKRRAHLS